MNKEISFFWVLWMWIKRITLVPFAIYFIYVGIIESHKFKHKKNNHRSQKRADNIAKFAAFIFDGHGTFINQPDDLGNCIHVCNHPTPVGSAVIGRHLMDDLVSFVASDDQWFTSFWAIEKIFTNANTVFVDRRSTMHRAVALYKTLKRNREGKRVLIFPEGNLTQPHNDLQLEEFHPGAFYIANKNQVPIIPIVETNSVHRFKGVKLSKQFLVAKIEPHFIFLEPYTKHLETEMTAHEIAAEIWQLIYEENKKHLKLEN